MKVPKTVWNKVLSNKSYCSSYICLWWRDVSFINKTFQDQVKIVYKLCASAIYISFFYVLYGWSKVISRHGEIEISKNQICSSDYLNDLHEKFIVVSIAKLPTILPSFAETLRAQDSSWNLHYSDHSSKYHLSIKRFTIAISNNLQFCERLEL